MQKTDLIISACANYAPIQLQQYINSINKSNFEGDKIMICYNLHDASKFYLRKNGWECIDSPLQGHPHMKRLIDMWHVLENIDKEYRFVITTDVRDVIFQTNPSNWLESKYFYGSREDGWWENIDVFIASERLKYEEQEWNIKNIHEGYGEIFWDWIKEKEIGNVGIIAGKYEGVKSLLMLNWLISQAGNTQHFTDQSSLNLLIHNHLIKDKIYLTKDLCLQVGTLNEELIIKDGVVYNPSNNKPYPIVHQWDRNETLKTLFEKSI